MPSLRATLSKQTADAVQVARLAAGQDYSAWMRDAMRAAVQAGFDEIEPYLAGARSCKNGYSSSFHLAWGATPNALDDDMGRVSSFLYDIQTRTGCRKSSAIRACVAYRLDGAIMPIPARLVVRTSVSDDHLDAALAMIEGLDVRLIASDTPADGERTAKAFRNVLKHHPAGFRAFAGSTTAIQRLAKRIGLDPQDVLSAAIAIEETRL